MVTVKEKEEKFVQMITFMRKENKNFLRSAAALQGKAMYEYLDDILNLHREKYLKSINDPKIPQPTRA